MVIGPFDRERRREKAARREMLVTLAVLLILIALAIYARDVAAKCEGDVFVGVLRLMCVPG